MSREIKFRAWSDSGKLYKDVAPHDNREAIIKTAFCTWSSFYADSIEQYTGLKDKNGKEIYEGDIIYDIYTGDEVFIVGWDKDKASFMLADTADYPMAYFDEYKLDKDLEVIGNVHENPELIGGGE